ncbi:uncharacterized protein Z518_08879 [Rhinocladiella mackenziei CBS 650.93]|uniref:Uncharacterized protein n=1 Tax=Rhinocladiella mackenziei CBS 650.93 TaxID=1442369 RepID=A0A0D2I5T4_9EURO|nr:uncharacterized protein Z518_08879 [Rhinocladiella mackenziei CBS 650.93]KIX01154.1 hypothetical protein Z518_08879 [Rhinocladiella mackenziei CBS 650.93]
MPVSTRATVRSRTENGQNSQQSGEADVSPTRGLTEFEEDGTRDEVDVHQPMGLRQMQDLVDNQPLSTEQLRILTDRIQELVKARTGKRAHEDSDEDDRPRKRRADHDLKYNNIKELKIGATLKAWSDWRIEIQRAFDASPYKYDNDCTKVIKALSHLDEDSKTLWNNRVRTNPDDEYDWEAFITWLNDTIRDQGNDEVTTQIEWFKARQRFDQTLWAFDVYLTSLEHEMEPKGERTRAMEFFSRLRPSLRRAIRLSGINPLPQTRQAMLSLATRMWEEIKHDEKDPRKEKLGNENKISSKANSSTSTTQSSSSKNTNHSSNTKNKTEKKAENKSWRSKGPKEFASGQNDKGERICFICGSIEHIASYHRGRIAIILERTIRETSSKKRSQAFTSSKRPRVERRSRTTSQEGLGLNRLVRFGKRVRLPFSPEEEPRMRTGDYLRTMGKLNVRDRDPEDVEIALDTCAEIDTVGVEFVKQRDPKPYIKEYPKLW